MHSSRMRTARLLPVSPSMHCSCGGTCLGGVPAKGGVPAQGGLPAGGVPAWGCTCPAGVPAQGGVYLSAFVVRRGAASRKGMCPTPHPHPPWWTDKHLRKYYLPATSLAGGKNGNRKEQNFFLIKQTPYTEHHG